MITLSDDDILDLTATGKILDTDKLVGIAIQKTIIVGRSTRGKHLTNKASATTALSFARGLSNGRLANGVPDKIKQAMSDIWLKHNERHAAKTTNNPYNLGYYGTRREEKVPDSQTDLYTDPTFFEYIMKSDQKYFDMMIVDIEKLYHKAGLKPPKIEIIQSLSPSSRSDHHDMGIETKADGSILIEVKATSLYKRSIIFWNNRLVLFNVSWRAGVAVFNLDVKRDKKGKVKSTNLHVVKPTHGSTMHYTFANKAERYILTIRDESFNPVIATKKLKTTMEYSNFYKEDGDSFDYRDTYDSPRKRIKKMKGRYSSEHKGSYVML